MAYQPTFPKPYLTTIDADLTRGNVFSVVINPKDVITKYELKIYNTGSSTSQLYTTGIITLDEMLYGSFDSGTTLYVNVPFSANMINGKSYNWEITLYDDKDDTVTTPLYYFITRSSPNITFDVPQIITSCEYEFIANYTQKQNEKYLYYVFSLYSNNELIDTSGEKMEAKISYTYTGFMPDEQYRIDLIVVMNDRTEYKISRSFTVAYESQETPVFPTVSANKKNGYIDIDYSQSIYIAGHTNDVEKYNIFKNPTTGTQYTTTQLIDSQYVYYNKINETLPIDIPDNFTIYLHENFLDFFAGKIVELTNESTGDVYSIRYDGRLFYYKIPGYKEAIVDPYVDLSGLHKEKSCVHPAGTTLKELQYDTLYMLYADDVLNADDVFMYNDITKNYWWHITLLPNRVLFKKGTKYDERPAIKSQEFLEKKIKNISEGKMATQKGLGEIPKPTQKI